MTGSSALVSLEEIQVIRLVLQFLSSRKLHKSARNLERETGITNCGYNDDVLFLRQLILDGEWDAILTYSQPLEKLEGFDAKSFRYLIFREKFMEILYFKSGVEGVSSSYSIEDMIKCLNHLETNCPTKSDYTKLCWLLTVTDLYDQPEYQGWNPETARIKCFGEVVDLLKKVMPLEKKKGNEKVLPSVSQNRLVNLVVKGLCFENCVDYCHQRAINGEVDNDGINVDNSVLAGASHESTGNFLSWLHSLPQESFVSPFEPVSLKVNFKKTSQIRKFNLSNKRLQNEAENLSKSLLMSERPSTASKVESKPVNPPESLSSVKKVSNSYSNFHYTKPNIDFKPIEPETGEGVPRRDSLNEADIPIPNNQDISTQADQNNHNSNHADQVSHSKDNKPSKREIHDSQDSLDRIKRNQENSVLKQLEEHEKQSAELRRQLMESSNVQAELHEMSPRATPNHQQQNIRHPSDGHSLPIDEDKLQTVNITSQVNSTKGRTQRESPVGKEVSPCFKDNTDNKPLQVTSTPLTKKKLIPEPLKLDNVTISRIEGPSVNESRHQDNNDMNQSHANEEKPIPESQFPKTPNALPTGHWISLADGSGTLNTSTPKSSRHQMSNTPGPLVSPVDAVEAESAIQTTNNLQPDDDKASPVIPSNDTPTPRRGPKINGVRRTLMSNGPPMSRNKGPTVPNEETPETKAPIREKSNKGGNTPRDRAPANQKQNPPKKNSREEAKPKPSVDNTGAINQANVKSTTKSSILTQQQREMSKTLEKQQGFMKNNPDAIRFCTVASLEDVQAIRAVAFHPSGDLFAVGSNSKTLRVCAATGLNNYKKLNSNEDMIPPQPTILFKRNRHHKGSIYCAAWSNTGDMLATGSNDKTIKVLRFDPENCTQVGPEMELNIHGGTVRDLVFATRSGGTSLLVSGGAGCGNVQITDTGTGNSIGQLKGHSGYIMSIYAAKDDIIATGSNDNTVRLWDLRSQRCIDAIATGESCVASVCVNPAGTLLSSGHEDGGCMIYDITAGRTLQFFKPHTLDCRSVRFSSDGHYLLTASYDTSIILLDMQYNLECNIPPYSVVAQHRDKVIQCRWHPQLMAFVSSSADKTASLWTLDC